MKNLCYFLGIAGIIACFATCSNTSSSTEEEEKAVASEEYYLAQGKEIAAASFVALSGRLQAALKRGGVSEAVQYCNLAALPLLDSLSQEHQASIRRTALKIRQPKDAPTPAEEKALLQYQAQLQAGEVLKPQVATSENKETVFYAPILLSDVCLKCHGKLGETLRLDDYALIKEQYPEDEAIGYSSGDLRGIWSITFATRAPSPE